MAYCRACQRQHGGRECPIDEQGAPNPPSVLIPVLQMAGYGGQTLTSNTSNSTSMVLTFYVPPLRPPDDGGLAGVPALCR